MSVTKALEDYKRKNSVFTNRLDEHYPAMPTRFEVDQETETSILARHPEIRGPLTEKIFRECLRRDIIELLRTHPGLHEDEIAKAIGIRINGFYNEHTHSYTGLWEYLGFMQTLIKKNKSTNPNPLRRVFERTNGHVEPYYYLPDQRARRQVWRQPPSTRVFHHPFLKVPT